MSPLWSNGTASEEQIKSQAGRWHPTPLPSLFGSALCWRVDFIFPLCGLHTCGYPPASVSDTHMTTDSWGVGSPWSAWTSWRRSNICPGVFSTRANPESTSSFFSCHQLILCTSLFFFSHVSWTVFKLQEAVFYFCIYPVVVLHAAFITVSSGHPFWDISLISLSKPDHRRCPRCRHRAAMPILLNSSFNGLQGFEWYARVKGKLRKKRRINSGTDAKRPKFHKLCSIQSDTTVVDQRVSGFHSLTV